MSSRRTDNIEALSERLESLQINKEASTDEYEPTDTEMSGTPAPGAIAASENVQAGLPKSMVPDPGWFNGDRSKFEDWWRGIRLFLKSNRVNGTDDKITAILAHLRGGVAGIYAQKKLDEFDEDNDTQDWEEFVKEFKTTFSDKSKAADAEWKIETFKQGKKNTADFMIEFEALATKADTDELHAIFLLKKNVRQDIIKTILGYPPIAMPETLKVLWQPLVTQGQMILQLAKLSSGLSSNEWGITRELDKEPLLHCSSIYIIYMWSVLQQYLTDPKVHAATSCPLLIHHAFTLRLPCFLHVP